MSVHSHRIRLHLLSSTSHRGRIWDRTYNIFEANLGLLSCIFSANMLKNILTSWSGSSWFALTIAHIRNHWTAIFRHTAIKLFNCYWLYVILKIKTFLSSLRLSPHWQSVHRSSHHTSLCLADTHRWQVLAFYMYSNILCFSHRTWTLHVRYCKYLGTHGWTWAIGMASYKDDERVSDTLSGPALQLLFILNVYQHTTQY